MQRKIVIEFYLYLCKIAVSYTHLAAKIDHALAETSIHYTVDLPRKAVIVEGTQDDVMKARAVIDEIGFTVK